MAEYVKVLSMKLPGVSWTMIDNDYDTLVMLDGAAKPSKEQLDKWSQEIDIALGLVAYKEKRLAEYPSVNDQLDMLFHDMTEGSKTWVTAIQTVKDKYPKGA